MIARLKGIVEGLGEDFVILDVGGVGYRVFSSGRTLARLQQGEVAILHVETHVREDHIHLYGFFDASEREWFLLLTTVQGVGAKVALSLLSVMAPEQLMQAIAAQDKTMLTRANGVGPKLAMRVVSELKDKAGKIGLGPGSGSAASVGGVSAPSVVVNGAFEDAVSALVNLGYRRGEAFEAVGLAVREGGEGANTSVLIKQALKRLGSQ